jgi:hypothetical protein
MGREEGSEKKCKGRKRKGKGGKKRKVGNGRKRKEK